MDRCDVDKCEECNGGARGREREMHGVLDVRGRVEEKNGDVKSKEGGTSTAR